MRRLIPVIVIAVLLACHSFIAAMFRPAPPPESRAVLTEPARKSDQAEASEVAAFEEVSAPKGDTAFKYFKITVKEADGSVRQVAVKVDPALIEDWAVKTIKEKCSKLPW